MGHDTILVANARSEKLMRILLLDEPGKVHSHDYDPAFMDTTPEHRREMRNILYTTKRGKLLGNYTCHSIEGYLSVI